MCANRGSEVRQPPGGHDLESKSEPSAHISTPSGLVPAQSVLAQGFGGRTPKTQPEPTPLQPAPFAPQLLPKCVGQRANDPLETVSTLTESLKNEHTKRILYTTGIRRPSLVQRQTPHYRMRKLQANGGYLELNKYDGPEIPKEEYENLFFTTYSSDDSTTLAPITSCTGAMELKGFEAYDKPDLDGVWTEHAQK